MDEQPDTPAPGVHPDTPMDDYHDWDAASHSRLSRLIRSPAHLKAYLEEPPSETPALRFGRAAHTAVLEPDRFASAYKVLGQCSGQKKDGNRCGKRASVLRSSVAYCGTHDPAPGEAMEGGVEILGDEEMERVRAMQEVVHAHPAAKGLLTGSGEAELSMLWEDEATGVLCKARWDRHSPDVAGGAIVDYKTTQDASPAAFEKAIFNYGYFRQGAMYLMGARARKLPARHFVIIAQEKDPPYAVAVYRLTEGTLDGGREIIESLLRRYAECRESGEYPGYPPEVQDISIPRWGWSQLDEQKAAIKEVAA